MPKYDTGTHILAYGKSHHAGQSGTVVADYGSHLLVKADDLSYEGAHRNSIGEGRYFQVDNLLCKEIPPIKES